MSQNYQHFSVIVPVYNGGETLDECLGAILNQDYPREAYEVIVVDDGSTDDSRRIAERRGVRTIALPRNEGRIVARITGAREATHKTLCLVDSRVIIDSHFLRKANDLQYMPLIGGDYGEQQKGGLFGATLFSLRRWYYRPYFPQTNYGPEIWISPDNFERVPKGLTTMIIDRDALLNNLPGNTGRHANDDSAILKKVAAEKPILRHTSLRATYVQRTGLRANIRHLFWRGPRFYSFYMKKGGRFHRLALALLVGLVFWLLALWQFPVPVAAASLGGALIGLILCAIRLAASGREFVSIVICAPVILAVFGAGIFWGAILDLIGALSCCGAGKKAATE